MTVQGRGSGSAGGSKLAAFDFDGTLRRGDSLLPFLSTIAGRRQSLAAVATSVARLAFSRRVAGRDGIKDLTFVRLLSGREAKNLAEVATKFGEALIDELRPDVVARLRSHQSAGHEVVVVSASLAVYLDPVADYLGCDLIATELAAGADGLVDGRIDGRNCRGPEKVARLEAKYPERPSEVWAYGDSAGDNEMLAWADHGIRIDRSAISALW